MEFRAYHGCYALEKIVGGRFSVSVSLEVEIGDAAERDDVTRTLNYVSVYRIVEREMSVSSDILENVALRISEALHASFSKVCRVTVRVSKLAPPVGGKIDRVSVILKE